jgi:carboxyl-terminal processing protease
MTTKSFWILLISGTLLLSMFSCIEDNPEPDPVIPIDSTAVLNAKIMGWMYGAMDEVYFWSAHLPDPNTLVNETDPEVFFDKLIYKQEDRWSWLTKDYVALMEEFAGTPTSMGMSPVFGRFHESDQVFILISFVYPDSPASRAGIKRGDIIMKINGEELNISNYIDLFNQISFTVNLGEYNNGTISALPELISLSAEVINSDPVVFDTVLSIGGHKIGYLTYVEFISGTNNNLLDEFGTLIDEFKNKGVSDLVVDLRYNPGGEITAANYLASSLAPLAEVNSKEVFVRFEYNSLVQKYFKDTQGQNSPNLVNLFSSNSHNLDLNRIYFLTGDHSASASELLIIGLKPYMEVIQIGDSTYGKYTGAWVITDTNDPPQHNWAIVPIVSKYSNADGFTDFADGLVPDYYIKDNLLEAKPFGSIEDPMLAKAIELITGQSFGIKKETITYRKYLHLTNPSELIKYNLFHKRLY